MLQHRGDQALRLLLRLLLAGCLCCPVAVALYGVHVARQIGAVGFSDDCIGDACLWISDGDLSAFWTPTQPCWQVYHRPC